MLTLIKERYITCLLLLVVLCLIGMRLGDVDGTENTTTESTEASPTYLATHSKTLAYDEKGKLAYQLQAKVAKNKSDTGDSQLTDPILFVFGETGKTEWKISATNANINEDKHLFLQDNVKVTRLEAISALNSIATQSATIDLNTQDIKSDERVRLVGEGFTSEGDGIVGNIQKQKAELRKNVKTIYQHSESVQFRDSSK